MQYYFHFVFYDYTNHLQVFLTLNYANDIEITQDVTSAELDVSSAQVSELMLLLVGRSVGSNCSAHNSTWILIWIQTQTRPEHSLNASHDSRHQDPAHEAG